MTRTWRCFHCGFEAKSIKQAVHHFGSSEVQTAICQIDAEKFREMERFYERACAEDTDKDREYHAMTAKYERKLIEAEQLGYDRGLHDAKELLP